MIKYKKLELCDKDLFDSFLKPYLFYTSEYSFTNLFIWKEGCNIEYAVYEGFLVIKKVDFDGKSHFMQPLGYKKGDYKNLRKILKILIQEKNELKLDFLFKDVEEWFALDLKEVLSKEPETKLTIEEDRDNFEYIYEGEKLINLAGKKYHKKKNHYNCFLKNYSFKIEEIDKDNDLIIYDCIKKAEEWYSNNKDKSKYLLYELNGIKEALMNIDKLDYKGIAIYIDDKICAFSFGEKMNDKLAVIHIEKADANIKGAYTFINRTFVKTCFSDTAYINREQDLGLEGLRKSKLSYNPVFLLKKYTVKIV